MTMTTIDSALTGGGGSKKAGTGAERREPLRWSRRWR